MSDEQTPFKRVTDALFRQNQFAIKYDLEAMAAAVRAAGVERVAHRTCLVGGTNGKGTTSAAIAALGMAAGLQVGLYTSPHLVDVRERMRVGGTPISQAAFVRLATEVLSEHSGQETPPVGLRALSYFELTTLIALRWFAENQLDLAVFEVGLGGRLDATNVLDPDVSVITSISLDHTDWLGDTVELIAAEKLGIARLGRPLVVHQHAGGINALLRAGASDLGDLTIVDDGDDPPSWAWAMARAAARHLAVPPGNQAVAQARMRWPGRRDVRTTSQGHWRWLDGAHNHAGTTASAAWLSREWLGRPAPLIVGLAPDRSADVLAYYASLASELHVVCSTSGKGTPAASLAEAIGHQRDAGVPWPSRVVVHDSPSRAIAATEHEPRVAVVGSLYVVGDALCALGETAETLEVWAAGPEATV